MNHAELCLARQAFLDDTIEYYRTHQRGVNDSRGCSYEMKCAIGRHVSVAKRKEFDQVATPDVEDPRIFNRLPRKLQALGASFLMKVQDLHDTSYYWLPNETKGNDLTPYRERQLILIKYDFITAPE